VEKVRLTVGKIYKRGSEVSFIILIIGLLELVIKKDAPKPESFNIFMLIKNSLKCDPYSTLYIGLIILIATPLSVLFYLFLGNLVEKSYKEGLLALLILAIILFSVFFGLKS
jgi:uncharacterized membrane protein